MNFKNSKQRLYALIFIIGAIILLARTIILISQGYMELFVLWVAALLLIEFILDFGWLITAMIWWITKDKSSVSITLRLAATAIILHAIRVAIFVLGRLGPQPNFDIRPEHRPIPATNLGWVYFALIMSVLGVVGVVVVWKLRNKAQKE